MRKIFKRGSQPELPEGTDWNAVRDRATAESWPVDDLRADYPTADRWRQVRQEGERLRGEAA